MFLLYINDTSTNIDSSFHLFAYDCIIYRIIDSQEDNNILQQNLNKIFHWAKTWQMKLNVEKCVFLNCWIELIIKCISNVNRRSKRGDITF